MVVQREQIEAVMVTITLMMMMMVSGKLLNFNYFFGAQYLQSFIRAIKNSLDDKSFSCVCVKLLNTLLAVSWGAKHLGCYKENKLKRR